MCLPSISSFSSLSATVKIYEIYSVIREREKERERPRFCGEKRILFPDISLSRYPFSRLARSAKLMPMNTTQFAKIDDHISTYRTFLFAPLFARRDRCTRAKRITRFIHTLSALIDLRERVDRLPITHDVVREDRSRTDGGARVRSSSKGSARFSRKHLS